MSESTKRFYNTKDSVITAVQKSLMDLKYSIEVVDRESGFIHFETGMSLWSWEGQKMSVLIHQNEDGSCDVQVSGKRKQTFTYQVTDFGEAKKIAKKLFEKMQYYI